MVSLSLCEKSILQSTDLIVQRCGKAVLLCQARAFVTFVCFAEKNSIKRNNIVWLLKLYLMYFPLPTGLKLHPIFWIYYFIFLSSLIHFILKLHLVTSNLADFTYVDLPCQPISQTECLSVGQYQIVLTSIDWWGLSTLGRVIRPANLRVGQLCEIVNVAIFDSKITYMRLVKMGQKSQQFLTQIVQCLWGNCVSLTLRSWELAGLRVMCSSERFV